MTSTTPPLPYLFESLTIPAQLSLLSLDDHEVPPTPPSSPMPRSPPPLVRQKRFRSLSQCILCLLLSDDVDNRGFCNDCYTYSGYTTDSIFYKRQRRMIHRSTEYDKVMKQIEYHNHPLLWRNILVSTSGWDKKYVAKLPRLSYVISGCVYANFLPNAPITKAWTHYIKEIRRQLGIIFVVYEPPTPPLIGIETNPGPPHYHDFHSQSQASIFNRRKVEITARLQQKLASKLIPTAPPNPPIIWALWAPSSITFNQVMKELVWMHGTCNCRSSTAQSVCRRLYLC